MGGVSDDRGISLLLRALSFAAEKHRHQRRKDKDASPYINHPIALASVLSHEGGVTDTHILCAALLHDTIEDTQTTPGELDEAFGPKIKNLVLEVTDDKKLPRAERKRFQIEHAARASHDAKLVKLADKICNLRDVSSRPPKDWSLRRKQEYFDWAKQVVDQIRDVSLALSSVFDDVFALRPKGKAD